MITPGPRASELRSRQACGEAREIKALRGRLGERLHGVRPGFNDARRDRADRVPGFSTRAGGARSVAWPGALDPPPATGSAVQAGEVRQLGVAPVAAAFRGTLEKLENTTCGDDDDECSDVHVQSSVGRLLLLLPVSSVPASLFASPL